MTVVRQWLYKLRHQWEHRVIVLMYHRVANLETDPWSLAVSPVHFEQQLQVLKRRFKVLSTDELLEQLRDQKLKPGGVVITFDDGYEDNCSNARPLLEKYALPATFFISSQYIESAQPFWWDELAEIILNTSLLPAQCALRIGNESFVFHLGEEQVLTDAGREKQDLWKWPAEPVTGRCALYLQLWERLKVLPLAEIISNLDRVKKWAGTPVAGSNKHRPMTMVQLQCLAERPLFHLGNHTATHLPLGMHTPDVQEQDLAACQQFLDRNCKRVSRCVAYPYGSYNEATLQLAHKNRWTAFTTHERSVSKASDQACLGRFKVENWEGSVFQKKLQQFFLQ